MTVRMGKNIFAFVADIFMLEFSLPICMTLDKPIKKIMQTYISEYTEYLK